MKKEDLKEKLQKEFEGRFPNLPPIIVDVGGDTDEIDIREQLLDFLSTTIDATWNSAIDEALKGIQNSALANLVDFYQSNRGSGHTYASVKGVENTTNAFLLVVDEKQKQNTGLPKEKQITLGGRDVVLGGRRFAIVVDNYAIQEMYMKIRTALTELKK